MRKALHLTPGILTIAAVFISLASCTSNKDQLLPTPIEFAQWQLAGTVSTTTSNATYENGYLVSACDDNHKMYVAMNGPLDTNLHKIPVMTWGSTLPPNAIAIDFAQGVGTDYLSVGGDSVYLRIDHDEGSRLEGRTEIVFPNYIHLVKATSAGPTNERDSATNGYIYLP